ncbi:hypothetical protein ACWC0C_45130 [Streptomyces sp. NPDC001709]
MTECVDNPAERLHALLIDFCKAGKELGPNVSNWNAWARALTYEETPLATDSAEFFARLSAAMMLPQQVRQAVGAVVNDPEQQDYMLRPLAGVEAAMLASAQAGHQVSHVWQHFSKDGDADSSAAIYSLLGCAHELRRAQVEAGLTDTDGQHLTTMINDLIEAVLASELNEADKQFLLTRLNDMLAAVQQARLRGRYALETTTDAAYGALTRRPNLIQRLRDAQLLNRLADLFTKFNTVLALTGQTVELSETTVHMLERGLGN